MIDAVIGVSDTHCGCRLGLCPPIVNLDDGGAYYQSDFQSKLWDRWEAFWTWAKEEVKGRDYGIVVNGDLVEGVHHGTTTTISNNMADQRSIVRSSIQDYCGGRPLYVVRGTEVHVGKQGVDEETIAREMGALPNEAGQYSRWDLRLRIGKQLSHWVHHIGTSGSPSAETSALTSEIVDEYYQASRWGREAPGLIVRSHRHTAAYVQIPSGNGMIHCLTTPGWQGKTPHVWRLKNGRVCTPQFGGVVILSDKGGLTVKLKVWTVEPSLEV